MAGATRRPFDAVLAASARRPLEAGRGALEGLHAQGLPGDER